MYSSDNQNGFPPEWEGDAADAFIMKTERDKLSIENYHLREQIAQYKLLFSRMKQKLVDMHYKIDQELKDIH